MVENFSECEAITESFWHIRNLGTTDWTTCIMPFSCQYQHQNSGLIVNTINCNIAFFSISFKCPNTCDLRGCVTNGYCEKGHFRGRHVISFNHGLPWCVKYMARGPPVTTKPFAARFCGDRRPSCHIFHTSRQAMIKIYYSTSIRKKIWYKTVVTLHK